MEFTLLAIGVGAVLAAVLVLLFLSKAPIPMCPDPMEFVAFMFGFGVCLGAGFFGGVWLVTQIGHFFT